MIWLNIKLSTVRSPEYIGSSPAERGTWLSVLAFCADQENGGRIVGAALWKDRQWQQACGVTLREVRASSRLIRIEGEDVVVVFYPIEREIDVQFKRTAGRMGGQAKTQAKTQAARENGASGGRPITQAETEAPNPSETQAETQRKGKEGKGKEEEGKETPIPPLALVGEAVEQGLAISPDKIYSAYPRHVGRADAIRAIGKAIRSGVAAERLLERTKAYASAVADWPEDRKQFIPHPATWFNRGSYDDDPSTWTHGTPSSRPEFRDSW